ncbi:hypothetical protein QR680_018252 [Steinernema hermaphroditum]|uniref:non-specific serine/threonine protein kinase n=1 Tax=Steinernema hermaphroditum TaxID=289476 RepID=A0AA39HJK7_9BILA|nr:hypothetical protein QR680_018252 [Steinernema hermaphroditum]
MTTSRGKTSVRKPQRHRRTKNFPIHQGKNRRRSPNKASSRRKHDHFNAVGTLSDREESKKDEKRSSNRKTKRKTNRKRRPELGDRGSHERESNKIGKGTVVRGKNKYEVVGVLGSGGFGDVYEVRDEAGRSFAMKTELRVEKSRKELSRLKMEIKAYGMIRVEKKTHPENVAHLLYMHDSGIKGPYSYFIMTFTGPSIESLLKTNEIGLQTAIRLCIETFEGIWELHRLGIMHRDIKPANFVVGRNTEKNRVFLVDLGMACIYVTDAKNMPESSKYKFLGTLAYASRASHRGKCLEFFIPDILPWTNESNENKCGEMKAKFFKEPQRYIHGVPTCFLYLPEIIDSIGVLEEPQYGKLRELMDSLVTTERVDLAEPFEWDRTKMASPFRAHEKLMKTQLTRSGRKLKSPATETEVPN